MLYIKGWEFGLKNYDFLKSIYQRDIRDDKKLYRGGRINQNINKTISELNYEYNYEENIYIWLQ